MNNRTAAGKRGRLPEVCFSQDARNKNRWIQEDVWRHSRHPNYFGEIMVWTGLYLYTLQSLSDPEKAIGLISPLFIAVLLLFVSGVPILEKSASKRWGVCPSTDNIRRKQASSFRSLDQSEAYTTAAPQVSVHRLKMTPCHTG